VLSIVCGLGLLLTQGRSNKSIVGKFFGGLYGLYGITGYLGDTLSYSRLLALGLATGLIGWAFNLLIGMFSGLTLYIFGPIIFAFGHTFNFLIGLLGTFVHTCRLQYLEFFGKFYEGGGKPYTPLQINTKFINVKKS
jgi:V/A-type H+-transporting ATPase subunit I